MAVSLFVVVAPAARSVAAAGALLFAAVADE